MKRSCKHIDLRDPQTVYPWVLECVDRHKGRHDFKRLLQRVGGLTATESERPTQANLSRAALAISEEACHRIAARDLALPPVTYRERVDNSSGKTRLIGNESAMQQVFDYIAVRSCTEIWTRRIVPQQVAGIPGRGAVYCARMVQGWVLADRRAAKWARAHHRSYQSRCKWYVKLDVRQCYPSLRVDRFLPLFERDCANEDILWLWRTLLSSHAVGDYKGFMIGALTSQWACQYMLSFTYRYATALTYERRGKRARKVAHMALQMDDLLMVGPSRKGLVSAARELTIYCADVLGLELKASWHVRRLNQSPIDLAGYRIHADAGVDVRPRIFLRARRMFSRCARTGFRPPIRQARRASAYAGWFVDNGAERIRTHRKHSDARRIIDKLRVRTVLRTARQTISDYERGAYGYHSAL